ncbi:MAG: inositol monophosphatase family protein [Verrucomicrobiota bacterium]
MKVDDFKELERLAIEAARAAGAVIRRHVGRVVEVKEKSGGSSRASQVLTEVDLLAQEAILKILEPTCATYDLALLSEERPDDCSRLKKDCFWCIDPLDGTLPFIEGSPGYAVSIALVARDGTPLIGVVFDPVEQVLYHAAAGAGAFRNEEPWQLKAKDAGDRPLSVITDRSFKEHPRFSEIMSGLERVADELGYSGVKTRFEGGAAMNACWVLEQAPACYFKFPKPKRGGGSLWDYAATACIYNEISAVASDAFGAPLDLNRSDSCFMNHRGILFATDSVLAERVMQLRSTLEN